MGDGGESQFGDFLEDTGADSPAEATGYSILKDKMNEVLATLTDRERKVLVQRFGFLDGKPKTLEEVGSNLMSHGNVSVRSKLKLYAKCAILHVQNSSRPSSIYWKPNNCLGLNWTMKHTLKKLYHISIKMDLCDECLKGYEPREQQKKMLLECSEAYQKNDISLIEAGTGTSQGMASFIPAVLWALKFERTHRYFHSHRSDLQEQLVQKDIPLLLKALKVELKAVLVKGMGNYVCLRKLSDVKHRISYDASERSRGIRKDGSMK